MGFIKEFLFFLFLFLSFVFTSKASPLDEDNWQLVGVFFLKKKCYLSIQDTNKAEKGTMHNSSMMVVNCEQFIPQPQRIFPEKETLKRNCRLRYVACYNSFYYRQKRLHQFLNDKPYEVDLLKDSYLRSIVILALLEHIKISDCLMSAFLARRILNLLEGESS